MAKHRIVSYNGSKTLIRFLAGSLAAVILLIWVVLSQSAFAEQVEMPFQAAAVDLPESELIQSQMTDFSDGIDKKTDNEDSWKVARMRVTAYCPCSQCCGEYSDGITACNHQIQDGDRFVAADNTYSFGTEMIIPGYNNSESVEVKDRGGAIQGDRLDVFFNTHQEALEWGVQYLNVLIKVQ